MKLANIFTSCKNNPINQILTFTNVDYIHYVIPWYIIHFNRHKLTYVGYGYNNTHVLLSAKQAELYTISEPICLFSSYPGKFFHIMKYSYELRLSLIKSIELFNEPALEISLDEDIVPFIKNSYKELNLKIDYELYQSYINNNVDIIKSIFLLYR